MQGVSVSGLPPPDGAGPERAAEAGGGGARLCGIPVLRRKSRGAAAHGALAVRGARGAPYGGGEYPAAAPGPDIAGGYGRRRAPGHDTRAGRP